MGKSPETLAGKLLKVRENTLRRIAARQGLRVIKLNYHPTRHPNGTTYFLAFTSERGFWSAPGTPAGPGTQLTLSEMETVLRDRQQARSA